MQKQLPPVIAQDSLAADQAVCSKFFPSDGFKEKSHKLPDQESVGARANTNPDSLVYC